MKRGISSVFVEEFFTQKVTCMANSDSKDTKTCLVYFCGTSTPSSQPAEHLSLNKLREKYKVHIVPGVATAESVALKREFTQRDPGLFAQKKESYYGYSEANHLSQLKYLFEALKDNPEKVVFAAHSRGASVALLACLFQMYLQSFYKTSSAFSSLKKISLIVIDPVYGSGKSNLLGLESIRDQQAPSIAKLLNTISENFGITNLFDVSIFLSRHDSRPAFEICEKWR